MSAPDLSVPQTSPEPAANPLVAAGPHARIQAEARWLADWLRLRALPLWATVGRDDEGGFLEAIDLDGRPVTGFRRSRVQTRQIYVYCQAGRLGWPGPWQMLAGSGLERLEAAYLRPDGASRPRLAQDWSVLVERPSAYDQAFVLFALAAARQSGVDDMDTEVAAVRLRTTLLASAWPNGAIPDVDPHPRQANAHMHLFEAALAWMEISDDPVWRQMADTMARLALTIFIDPDAGFVREFFDEDWTPAPGDDGRLLEPGHQFEWAWLLIRYARMTGDGRARGAAGRLYRIGDLGTRSQAPVTIDALNDDLTIRSQQARLWPQPERLRAALILAEEARGTEREAFLENACSAMSALRLYLTDDGLWRDKRRSDGSFVGEPAPATSLYHILGGFVQTQQTLTQLDISSQQGPTI